MVYGLSMERGIVSKIKKTKLEICRHNQSVGVRAFIYCYARNSHDRFSSLLFEWVVDSCNQLALSVRIIIRCFTR